MARQIPQTQSFKLPGYNWRRGKTGWDKHTWLYIAVILAVVLGATIGLLWPELGVALEPVGKAFVALIKMMIAPIIFCTIVVGIGSIAKAATVGKIGGLALLYFMVMTTFALAIGLVVGNIIHPGQGLDMSSSTYDTSTLEPKTTQEFILGIIPTTFFSAFTGESVLQVLFIALLVGFALQQMGTKGEPIMNAVKHLQALVFRILGMILWLAPLGAFGAIAAVVGKTGCGGDREPRHPDGRVLHHLRGVHLRDPRHAAVRRRADQHLQPHEVPGPRVPADRRHVVVASRRCRASSRRWSTSASRKPVVGITVPTGYSFNLDGTAIYLTMASLFIAAGMGMPMSIPEQIGLLAFMVIASKGAAGVTGAGLATLAGGLQAYRPDLVDGVGVIVGIDRFMSEGRARHELHRQRRRDRADRHLDEGDRQVAGAPGARGGGPRSTRRRCQGDHDGMSTSADAVGTQGLEEAAVAEAAEKQRALGRAKRRSPR